MAASKSVLALDVGARRIGLAIASLQARLPRPLTTLINDPNVWPALQKVIDEEAAGQLVVGLPRGLEGQATAQTGDTIKFAEELKRRFGLPVDFIDEALTSKQAEAELEARGKPYRREDIDALAATYILGDWLGQNGVK